jgi:hypothetical protein
MKTTEMTYINAVSDDGNTIVKYPVSMSLNQIADKMFKKSPNCSLDEVETLGAYTDFYWAEVNREYIINYPAIYSVPVSTLIDVTLPLGAKQPIYDIVESLKK